MAGYLTRWRDDQNPILRAVSKAGDAFHHTSQWDDDYYGGPTPCEWIEAAAREMDMQHTDLLARVAELEEALRPFARVADTCRSEAGWRDDHVCDVLVADLRRARAALGGGKGEE